MKKILSFVLITTLLVLSGCNSELVDEKEIDQVVSIDVVLEKDGITTTHTFLHIDRYQSFEEMVSSEIGEFRKLKILDIQDFSDVSNKLICEDQDTGETVEVIIYKSFVFEKNRVLYLHLTWGKYVEAYMLSDLEDSIFMVKSNGKIKLPENFVQDLIIELDENSFKEKIR